MIVNMGGGGGGIAHILANVPPNSTVTCVNGSTTLTQTNSGSSRGNVAFAIPTTGTWTVTATSGTSTSSTSVSVASGGAYYVQLFFTTYLIQNAVVNSEPQFSDEAIVQNKDAQGHDLNPTSRGVWRYSTIGDGGHHYVQWGPIAIGSVNRIAMETAAAGKGTGVPAFCPNEIGITSNRITDTQNGTNTRLQDVYTKMFLMPNQLETINLYVCDVSANSGNYYITLGWQAVGGYNVFFDIKNMYYQT